MTKLIVATLATALLLAGCSTAAPSMTSESAAPAKPRPTASADIEVKSAELGPVEQTVPPVRVAIGVAGVDVPVVPVGLEADGTMELPDNPAIAGWYKFGEAPTSADGNTVISAHIDAPSFPVGPFASLRSVPAGAEVVVTSADGTSSRYAVDNVTYYPKSELPTDLLFARTGQKDLILITCGGAYNARTGHYDDNVVLVAHPID